MDIWCRSKRARSLVVEYLACTEDTRVQFAAGPFILTLSFEELRKQNKLLKKIDDEPNSATLVWGV